MTAARDDGVFSEAAVGSTSLSFAEAVAMFLEYLKGYRNCAAVSVQAYGRDIQSFAQFLSNSSGAVPPPDQITRQQVMQFAVGLTHLAPLSVRRKLWALSSFFGFLQDMGYLSGNPAKRLPFPSAAVRYWTQLGLFLPTRSIGYGPRLRRSSSRDSRVRSMPEWSALRTASARWRPFC
jgi:hypothetical protein